MSNDKIIESQLASSRERITQLPSGIQGIAQQRVVEVGRTNIVGMLSYAAQVAAFTASKTPQILNEKVGSSLLGARLHDSLRLIMPNYTNEQGETVESLLFDLQDVIVSANLERNIVKTNMKGKKGTFKEFIQNGDYKINVVGKIVNNGRTLPIQQTAQLIKILSAPVALDYECRFLFECFKIKQVVCDGNPKFYQLEGVSNAYAVEFELLSDED